MIPAPQVPPRLGKFTLQIQNQNNTYLSKQFPQILKSTTKIQIQEQISQDAEIPIPPPQIDTIEDIYRRQRKRNLEKMAKDIQESYKRDQLENETPEQKRIRFKRLSLVGPYETQYEAKLLNRETTNFKFKINHNEYTV